MTDVILHELSHCVRIRGDHNPMTGHCIMDYRFSAVHIQGHARPYWGDPVNDQTNNAANNHAKIDTNQMRKHLKLPKLR